MRSRGDGRRAFLQAETNLSRMQALSSSTPQRPIGFAHSQAPTAVTQVAQAASASRAELFLHG